MDFLFENPLARMYGPYFIVLYISLYVVAILVIRLYLPEKMAGKADEELPPLPLQPNVHSLAFLRAGKYDLLALMVFDLHRRGFFKFETKKKTSEICIIVEPNKKTEVLSDAEKNLISLINDGKSVSNYSKTIRNNIKFETYCDTIRSQLVKDNLYNAENNSTSVDAARNYTMLGLIGLGLYKLIVAASHHHTNVIFLIIVGALGTRFLYNLRIPSNIKTQKGNKVLEHYRKLYKAVNGDKIISQPHYLQTLLLAIHGFSILDGSMYQNFYSNLIGAYPIENTSWFETSSSSGGGSGSCGSSGCGSSCGGGCGGGCGGCS